MFKGIFSSSFFDVTPPTESQTSTACHAECARSSHDANSSRTRSVRRERILVTTYKFWEIFEIHSPKNNTFDFPRITYHTLRQLFGKIPYLKNQALIKSKSISRTTLSTYVTTSRQYTVTRFISLLPLDSSTQFSNPKKF